MNRTFIAALFLSGLALGVAQAQPAINTGGIVSASGFGEFNSIAPGDWIEIYGSNLASTTGSWVNDFNGNDAPTSVDGTSVTIAGQLAFIDYVSPTQVNAQVPSNVPVGSQPVIVKTNAGGSSAPYMITVNATEPGFLAPASFNVGGMQYVEALFLNGSYVLPPNAVPGFTSQRAQPGDTIIFYGVGFGSVIPNTPAGQIVQKDNTLAAHLQIKFGNTLATVTYDGLAPDAVGLYQFNVTVPTIPSSDAVPVTFTLGGVAGTQTLYTAVQNGSLAPQVQSLTLSPTSATGGTPVQGTVTLTSPAPTGGAVVMLSSNSASASVPPTVTVPEGATSATFTISTSQVTSSQSVTLTASYDGSTKKASLTLTAASTLPQFTQIIVSGTVLFNQMTYGGEAQIVASPGPAYSIGTISGTAPTALPNVFGVSFNTISVAGDTFTLTGVVTGPSSYVLTPTGQFGITAGSATITLAPSGAPSVGNATGTFTVTSALGTMTGTLSGPYSAF